MPQILFPSPFERGVLAQEAPGGEPASASIVVPTLTVSGKPFPVRLAVLDERGYPSIRFDGAVKLRGPLGEPAGVEVAFAGGRPAVAVVEGLTVNQEGLFRLECELDGRVFHSNPTRCQVKPEEFIYWGDPHVHTYLSDCGPERGRSLNFCYVAGRWLSRLDFVAAADHVSWGRCSKGKWLDQAATSDAFNEPGRFVTLPSYEASLDGGLGGDNNVYMTRWPETWVDVWEEKGSTRDLCAKMAELLDESDFFIVPHHTTRTGKHGEIPEHIFPGERMMPVVEVHSNWGTSEYRGNPNPLKKIHPGPSYVVDLLNQGLPLGLIAGTDTHATMPGWHAAGEPGHLDRLPGLTAVRARRLTREDIFGGIRARNCYAASLERIYLDVSAAGAAGGECIRWSRADRPRRISVTAAARSDLTAIEIIRNGQTIAGHAPDDWTGTFEYADADDLSRLWLDSPHLGRFLYYYVRVTCASGAQAWSSPVWLTR